MRFAVQFLRRNPSDFKKEWLQYYFYRLNYLPSVSSVSRGTNYFLWRTGYELVLWPCYNRWFETLNVCSASLIDSLCPEKTLCNRVRTRLIHSHDHWLLVQQSCRDLQSETRKASQNIHNYSANTDKRISLRKGARFPHFSEHCWTFCLPRRLANFIAAQREGSRLRLASAPGTKAILSGMIC